MKTLLSLRPLGPGLALAAAVSAAAFALDRVQHALWGHAWLEALVLAIVLGSLLRSTVALPAAAADGIRFATKPVMETAVALMGASLSLSVLARMGLVTIGAIMLAITVTITLGYRLGRLLGLSAPMAMLVACGNAICGNSAIVAVAPTIDADGDDVAASVGFTAVMGILVVLILAPVAHAFHLSAVKGGMLAGMTVYAVPQVLAAASPLGSTAVQMGTLVKLVRVLMLGPVVATLSLLRGRRGKPASTGGLSRFLPIFVLAFLALAALRSVGLIPDRMAQGASTTSLLLTVLAMAGLGLGVDMRSIASAGARVTGSVILSLTVLFAISLALIGHLA
ncbi:MAG: putative sulfate exporter family transporter [Sphingomonadales bacterium]|nr:putative sulfate exporter family transporter [Sphingomonadales bacterium]